MAKTKEHSRLVVALAVLMLAAGIGLLYWLYFLKPAVDEIDELQGEISALQSDITLYQEKQDQKVIIESRWSDLQKREQSLKSKIPDPDALPQVVGALDKLIRSSPLELASLELAELDADERYRFIPLALKVAGGRKELLGFLKELERFPHALLIDEAAIERTDKGSMLSVSCRLIFISKEGAEEVGAEEEGEEQT